MTITGEPLGSFDISWVDPDLHAYLLSDRSNKAVDVINTVTKDQSKLAPGGVPRRCPDRRLLSDVLPRERLQRPEWRAQLL